MDYRVVDVVVFGRVFTRERRRAQRDDHNDVPAQHTPLHMTLQNAMPQLEYCNPDLNETNCARVMRQLLLYDSECIFI